MRIETVLRTGMMLTILAGGLMLAVNSKASEPVDNTEYVLSMYWQDPSGEAKAEVAFVTGVETCIQQRELWLFQNYHTEQLGGLTIATCTPLSEVTDNRLN